MTTKPACGADGRPFRKGGRPAGFLVWLCAAGFATSLWVSAAVSPGGSTNSEQAVSEEFVPPQSVFVWSQGEKGFGRDPFFPNTERFKKWKAGESPDRGLAETVANRVAKVEKPPPPKREIPLDLQGVFGASSALVNGISLRKGEEGTIQAPDGAVKVRLDEIRAESVVMTIWLSEQQTEQRELKLHGPDQ